jgi:transposase
VVAIINPACEVLVKPTPFGEDAPGYQKLFALLDDPADILVAMEATGHYGQNLLSVLTERRFPVAFLNPLRTRRFAQTDLIRAKNDSIDALGIARFAAQKRLEPTPPMDQARVELREMVRLLDRFTQDQGDRLRQLHRQVDLGFPEFTQFVRTMESHRATAILAAYPTAAAFTESCFQKLARLRYDGRRRIGPRLARTLIDAASTSVGRHHGLPNRTAVQYLCDDITRLRNKLEELRTEIERQVRVHPVGTLLTSIEGLGTVGAARIIAAVGDPGRLRSGASLAAYVGVVPADRQSGQLTLRRASLSPIGNPRLRRSLFMTTLGAVRRNPWLAAHYQRLRGRGKPPKLALIATLRKLLMAVHSVAKHRCPFIPRVPDTNEVHPR